MNVRIKQLKYQRAEAAPARGRGPEVGVRRCGHVVGVGFVYDLKKKYNHFLFLGGSAMLSKRSASKKALARASLGGPTDTML